MNNNKNKHLLDRIEQALGQVNFGSVEIIVQDKKVTQISVRSIQKTSIDLSENIESQPSTTPDQKVFTIQAQFRRRTD